MSESVVFSFLLVSMSYWQKGETDDVLWQSFLCYVMPDTYNALCLNIIGEEGERKCKWLYLLKGRVSRASAYSYQQIFTSG